MTTLTHRHATVWLDHHSARVFHIEESSFDETTLRAPGTHVKRHPDHNAAASEHPDDLKRFFHDVAKALDSSAEVLVLGPSTAKVLFIRYLEAHHPDLARRVVGVETVDHPTDPQVAAFARRYFKHADRMNGLVP